LTAHGLIDTTEMYLRTVFELEEEGIVPLRARIAERLSQSGPTVSQTVARMERDGLLRVEGDRQLSLTETGRTLAVRVMRKHRLAECLLVGVIGLPWEEVHIEACRWEHVISDTVERRLVELLGYPVSCPHGNTIPGLDELGVPPDTTQRAAGAAAEDGSVAMTTIAGPLPRLVIVRRISEQVQSDAELMHKLRDAGIQPGCLVELAARDDGVRVRCEQRTEGEAAELPRWVAAHVFVTAKS
jgi:DtxR family Mn-dependent transcriptional regulator